MRSRRPAWSLVLLPLSIAAAISLYPWKWFPFEIVQKLAGRRDIDIETLDYDYSPLTGLNLYGTEARMPLPEGEAVFKAAKVNVQLDPGQLAAKNFWCKGIEVLDASITLDLHPSRKKAPAEEEPPDFIEYDARRPRFQPDSLVLTNANLFLREPGTQRTLLQLEGLSAILDKPTLSSQTENPFAALIARGSIQDGTLRYGARKYSGLRGRFRLINAVLFLDRLELSSTDGRHHLSDIRLDLGTTAPKLRADLQSELSDARFLFSDLGIWPERPVPGSLKCRISGLLARPSIAGALSLAASQLQPRKLPVFAEVSQLFLDDNGPLRAQGDWVVPFAFTAPNLDVGKTLLQTDRLSLELAGRVWPKEARSVDADVILPVQSLPRSFPARIVPTLKMADEVRIPFKVTEARQELRRDKHLSEDTLAELEFFLHSRTVFSHKP